MHWSFGKHFDSPNYTDVPNVNTFYYVIQKVTFNVTNDLIRKVFKNRSSGSGIYKFSRIPIFARILTLTVYRLFSLKEQAHFVHFGENMCQIAKF